MNILVFHQYYLAPNEPGGLRFNEFARLWSEAGHSVTVIAGNINYATGRRIPGTEGRWHTVLRDGAVTVWRCHVPRAYARGYVGRAWAFAAFFLSAATAAWRAARPDVVVATSPPLTIALNGWVAANLRLHRARWVFEIRDLWPESAVTTGVIRADSLLTRLLYRLERFACRRADRVNVLTPAFRDDLLRRGLTPANRIVFVPNGADADIFLPGPRDNDARRRLGWASRFVALYAGAHGRANALAQLIDAAERLRDRPDILIVCAGDGPERAALEADAAARGLDNITFLGPQAKEEMPSLISAADAGLAVLQDNPTFRTVYPNKVFDYMACERPVVLGIDGAARDMVCEQARAGLFVTPGNGAEIAAAVRTLADDPALASRLGSNGRAWVLEHATREALAARYARILEDLHADRS